MKQRESFLVYKSWYTPIKNLTDEQLGTLLRAIFEYQVEGSVTCLDESSPAFMAFEFIKNQFRLDDEKYQDRCEQNRRNVEKRYERKQSNTKATDNDKDKEKEKGKEKVKEKGNDLIFPFPAFFKVQWAGWLEYKKKEHGFKYKSVMSEQVAVNKLYELSEGDCHKALAIIEQSIANGYKGLFELKGGKPAARKGVDADYLQELKQRINGKSN